MKSRLGILSTLGVAIWVVGCTTSPTASTWWSGKRPVANGSLYRQAETVVLGVDREKAPECTSRHVVKSELVKPPLVTAESRDANNVSFAGTAGTPNSYYIPPERRYSEFVENWTVDRCGKEVVYRVTFSPKDSLEGGTLVKAELVE